MLLVAQPAVFPLSIDFLAVPLVGLVAGVGFLARLQKGNQLLPGGAVSPARLCRDPGYLVLDCLSDDLNLAQPARLRQAFKQSGLALLKVDLFANHFLCQRASPVRFYITSYTVTI